tara:strand:- start:145 stop:846 length:702 start_codon:yes stop_codon:yes gene_type:complete
MAYFQELPNILYPSLIPSRNKVEERIPVKNIFKRAKLRSDLDQAITSFNYYTIKEGMRPDVVAQELYDNSELDWVVLISNNITNIRNEWPLDHNDLHEYLLEKYISESNISGVHHHETIQIIDQYSRLIMEENLEVDSIFNFEFRGTVESSTGSLIKLNLGGTSITKINPVRSITNYQYEVKLNDEKRRIKVLKPAFLSAFISEHKEIMSYDQSSDYISKRLKGTYNPRISGV